MKQRIQAERELMNRQRSMLRLQQMRLSCLPPIHHRRGHVMRVMFATMRDLTNRAHRLHRNLHAAGYTRVPPPEGDSQ